MEREVVRGDAFAGITEPPRQEIVEAGAFAGITDRPSWSQLNAKNFATAVIVALGIVALLGISYFWFTFDRPSLEAMVAVSETQAEAFARYKDLDGLVWTRFYSLLQLLIGTVALPLLTLLLGYAFGARQTKP